MWCIGSGSGPIGGPVRRQAHPCLSSGSVGQGRGHDDLGGSSSVVSGPLDLALAPGRVGLRSQWRAGGDLGTERWRGGAGAVDELVGVEGVGAVEHVVQGARELMGEDGERLGLAVLAGEASDVSVGGGVLPQAQRGSFGEGPLQVGVTDLFPGVPIVLPSDCLAHFTRRQ
jgi:hypothetical protein